MKKLIRDRYNTIIDASKLELCDSPRQHFSYLQDKLREEINELAVSNYKDIEEYADVIEVLYALAKINGINVDHVESARVKKHYDKGGFDKGLILNCNKWDR